MFLKKCLLIALIVAAIGLAYFALVEYYGEHYLFVLLLLGAAVACVSGYDRLERTQPKNSLHEAQKVLDRDRR